uniref:Reverse transcriptase domain-containing protein n=1 Tax=Tanacetum cinerariifolium TaxID=118510 RepID=A0A6L2NAF3_TANCI|nr:reverse transcriptase domain-containing protein [Tanacetum cinerariifolium]
MEDKEELPDPWTLFTNRSSCIDGYGAGLILTNPEGVEFTYALRFRFNTTNNEAEYEALITGLLIAEQMDIKNLQANVDLRLVANQVNETYIAKEPGMIKYLEKVRTLTTTFKEFSIKQVPRGENKKADALSKMAPTSFAHLSKQVLVEELKEKSINEKEVLAVVKEEGCTWMTPFYKYLTKEILQKQRRRQEPYAIRQANYVLREIHEESCSMHAGPRSVVAKSQRSRNGETSFSLTYGTEAVIPVEIDMPTLRTIKVDMIKNDEALEINLDILEEKRTSSIGTLKQAIQKMEASSDLSRKDHIRSWKR